MVTLRYFDCRGRAQPLRYLLADAGVEFQDLLVRWDPSWFEAKEDPAVGGPFGVLPLLQWDDLVLGETLAIAGYLARRLGHYRGRSDEQIARLEMVAASAFLNVLTPAGELLFPFPGPQEDQWVGFLQAFADEIPRRIGRFERLLAASLDPFFGGRDPVGADFFVFEAVETWRMMLAPVLDARLAAWPRLRALLAAVAERPRLRGYLEAGRRPETITASPLEPEIRRKLAAQVTGAQA
jgi:glutathione S-transferase